MLQYVTMPIEILELPLTLNEKFILSLAKTLNQGCFLSNQQIATMLGISKGRVSHIISKLVKDGMLDISLEYKPNSKEVSKRTITIKKAIEKVQEVVQSIKDKVTGGKNKTIKQEQTYTTTTKTVGTEKVQQVTFGNKYYQKKKTWQDNIYSHNWDLDELEMLAMRRTERDVEEYRRENTNDKTHQESTI